MLSTLLAINPREAESFIELVIAIIGVTKFPVLGVAGLAAWLAYKSSTEAANPPTSTDNAKIGIFSMVAGGAAALFLAGLVTS